MQKVLDALDMSQNLGKVDGVARMIGTRYALGDPYEVYSRRGQFKARVKPATDNGRVDGKPVYFSQEVWESKVNGMSAAILASQMLQSPIALFFKRNGLIYGRLKNHCRYSMPCIRFLTVQRRQNKPQTFHVC
jgi:hypothetical protein